MRYDVRLPHGFSKQKLRDVRKYKEWKNLVEIHHVVPKEFKYHPTILKYKYDVEQPYNLILVPANHVSSHFLRLRSERPHHREIHNEGYNTFTRFKLDSCDNFDFFVVLIYILHRWSRGTLTRYL